MLTSGAEESTVNKPVYENITPQGGPERSLESRSRLFESRTDRIRV